MADLPPRKVLVVDDSKFVRATFVRILESSFVVREEPDGDAGWRAIQGDPVHRDGVLGPQHAEARRLRPAGQDPGAAERSASRRCR